MLYKQIVDINAQFTYRCPYKKKIVYLTPFTWVANTRYEDRRE